MDLIATLNFCLIGIALCLYSNKHPLHPPYGAFAFVMLGLAYEVWSIKGGH